MKELKKSLRYGLNMWEESLAIVGDEPARISNEEYESRQNRIFSQLKNSDLLIITNPHESTRSNDVHYHYRSSSDMIYLTGWRDPESTFCAYNDNGEWLSLIHI